MTSSDRARGFTLLEMLVVLFIAGIALALTSQALGQFQRAHSRAIASERAGREQRLSEAWLRDAIRGLQAEGRVDINGKMLSRDAPPFKGTPAGFSGSTLAPVFASPGAPIRQEWRVVDTRGGSAVQVREQGVTVALALGRSDFRFGYLDADGALHSQWPPAQGAWPELPAAIFLESSAAPGSPAAVLVQAVLGPQDPVFRQYEFQHE